MLNLVSTICKADLQLVSPQHALVLGVAPTQVQVLALPLVQLFEVTVSLFLQPVEIPLGGSMILCDPKKIIALLRFLAHHVYSSFHCSAMQALQRGTPAC